MKKNYLGVIPGLAVCAILLAGCQESEVTPEKPTESTVSINDETSNVSETAAESEMAVSDISHMEPPVTEYSSLGESITEDVSAISVEEGLITIGDTETGFRVTINENTIPGGYDVYGEGDYSGILYLYPDEEQMSSVACQRFDHQSKSADEFLENLISGYGTNYAHQNEKDSITMGGHEWWTQSMEMKIGGKKDIITFYVADIDNCKIVLTGKERVDSDEQTELSASLQLIMDQCMETVVILN